VGEGDEVQVVCFDFDQFHGKLTAVISLRAVIFGGVQLVCV